MDPVQAAASITAVINALKKAREVVGRLKDAEVQAILLDAQEHALSLKEDVLALRAENLALKEQLAAKSTVKFDGGGYWSTTGDGHRDGPFCSRCYDAEAKLVRLQPTREYWHQCPNCGKSCEVMSAPRKPDPPPLRRALPRED